MVRVQDVPVLFFRHVRGLRIRGSACSGVKPIPLFFTHGVESGEFRNADIRGFLFRKTRVYAMLLAVARPKSNTRMNGSATPNTVAFGRAA
jgi:hypothetical protein